MLFVFSLRSALFAAKPAIHNPSHTHAVPSDVKVLVLESAGSTCRSPRCHWLRTIWKVEQRRHLQPLLIGNPMADQRTRRLDRRLSGTRTGVRLAESCAKRPTASLWWTRRSLTWCITKLGKFSLQVTMVLWTLALQDEADEKNTSSGMENPPNSAWSPDSAVKPQSQGICRCCHALSVKAGATFTWFCLRVMSREEISSPAKRWPTMLQGRFPDPLKL